MGIFDFFRGKAATTTIQALPAPEVSSLPDGYLEDLERMFLGNASRRGQVLGLAQSASERSSYARICANKVATCAASVPWVLEVEQAASWARITEGTSAPLRILEHPNRHQTRAQFVRAAMGIYQTAGRVYFLVHRNRLGQATDILMEPPSNVRENPVGVDGSRTFTVQRGGEFSTYTDRDVFTWSFPVLEDPRAYTSPWRLSVDERTADAEASQWQRESMAVRVVPDLILQVGRSTTQAQARAISDGLDRRKTPGSGRASLVVDSEITIHNLNGQGKAEVDFVESRKGFQEIISAVFGVPRPVIGFLENATLANLEASETMFWTGTVIPYLRELGEIFEVFLGREYGLNFRVRPDDTGIPALRASMASAATAAVAYHSVGVPFDVVSDRLNLGFPAFPGSDTGFLQAGLAPAEMMALGDLGDFTGTFGGTADPGDGDV